MENRAHAAGVCTSSTSEAPNVPVAYHSAAVVEDSQSRSDASPIFAMKPTGIADDPTAHPTVWSARVGEIQPGHSAKFHILWQQRLVEGFVVNFGGRYYAYIN